MCIIIELIKKFSPTLDLSVNGAEVGNKVGSREGNDVKIFTVPNDTNLS